MSPQTIIADIDQVDADTEELRELAAAALQRLWRENEDIDAESIEMLDQASGGGFTRELVEQYRNQENVSQLIRLVVARSEPDFVGDAVHEIALHFWQRNGRAALEAVFNGICRDIEDRERNGRFSL